MECEFGVPSWFGRGGSRASTRSVEDAALMDARSALTLPWLQRAQHMALLVLRVGTGAFLIHGVIDNIASTERMAEFAQFLLKNGFVYPQLMAPLSVWVQFACGVAFILGAGTRWAGVLCTFNFVVACVMVHWHQDFRGWWPALALVFTGMILATVGPGRLSVDTRIGASP